MKPKNIPVPNLISGKKLSALELNKFHFNTQHTVLTPEQLLRLNKSADNPDSSSNSLNHFSSEKSNISVDTDTVP